MTIKNSEALSMTEALEVIEKTKTDNPDLVGFIKKFGKLKPAEAKEIKKELQELGLIKVKEDHVVKIIDLISEPDLLDFNKVFTDVTLDDDETNKIQSVIDKHK